MSSIADHMKGELSLSFLTSFLSISRAGDTSYTETTDVLGETGVSSIRTNRELLPQKIDVFYILLPLFELVTASGITKLSLSTSSVRGSEYGIHSGTALHLLSFSMQKTFVR